MDTATPMLKQYLEIKARYKECILFFRLGDFYEMFAEDATRASAILNLVLTSRDAGKSGRIPMCGIPYHAAEGYISKLIKAGLKVAICEQVEDPALAKGLVRREVIRIITSGTYIDENSFESRYIIGLNLMEKAYALAFTDTASGTIYTKEYPSILQLAEAISKIPACECVFALSQEDKIREIFKTPFLQTRKLTLSPIGDWSFNPDIAQKSLLEHFQIHNLRGFGIAEMPSSISASGALLAYLKQMHKQPLRHLHKISLYADTEYVFISPEACYGLDLENLMQAIDHTQTCFGRRMLKDWVYHPLKSRNAIIQRQNAVKLLADNTEIQKELERCLHNTPDIEKSVSRISCGTGSARDLMALRLAMLKHPDIHKITAPLLEKNPLFKFDDIPEIRQLLEKAINPDTPLSHPEGKIICAAYNKELDALRDIQENGRRWLKDLQEREIKRSGINSLKIGFNQVFGYYIEISKANIDKVPHDYIRKQTLTNGERYITPELKEFEEKILTAENKILQIERRLVEEIFRAILDKSEAMHAFSMQLATLDALYSLSIIAKIPGYISPIITDDLKIEIKDGRHPIVEKFLSEPFIPNDTLLDTEENHLIILTGPNMAGKSTYIRQTAILVIMSQMGSYIPAEAASVGIVDKIFTRIGAHDQINKGQSTFMVEMSETAGILNNLSPRSLVVLDEIGRGTSTFDGLSLAWAISEYLAKTKTRTLFATHFHELTALSEEFNGVKNYNVAVKEWNDEVIFLHKIVPGGTDDSYGIYVAKLAGIPKEVVRRSEQILARLEITSNLQENIRNRIPSQTQIPMFNDKDELLWKQVKKEIHALDINRLSPIQALNKLQELKDKVEQNE